MNVLKALVLMENDEEAVDLYIAAYLREREEKQQPRTSWDVVDTVEFKRQTRFEQSDFVRLRKALRIPDEMRFENGCILVGEEALFILLRRFAYPCRLMDIGNQMNCSVALISVVRNQLCAFLHVQWKHLLEQHTSRFGVEKLREYSQQLFRAGCPLSNCIGFIDGTLRPTARPKMEQRLFYSGHKRVHGVKFQSILTADGIVSHLSGPYEGCRHDCGILKESGFMSFMEGSFHDGNGPFCIYGDPAYHVSEHILSPYEGAHLSPEEMAFNSTMSSYRIAVEWGFGKIAQQFAFLDFKKNLKLGLQPVGMYYIIGALLANCHTCLYGSQMGSLLGMEAPTLEDYLIG